MEGSKALLGCVLLAIGIMHPAGSPLLAHALGDAMAPAMPPGAAVATPVGSAIPDENASLAPTAGGPSAVPLRSRAARGPEALDGTANQFGTGACAEKYEREVTEEAAFDYLDSGMSWDADPTWECTVGRLQSPINVPYGKTSSPTVPEKFRIKIGHASSNNAVLMVLPILEVEMLGDFVMEGFQVPVCNATATPPDVGCFKAAPSAVPTMYNLTFKNIHFHSVSEHAFDGHLYPLEAHLVTRISNTSLPTCPPSGCLVVFGQTFAFGVDGEKSPFLDDIIPYLHSLGTSCTPLKKPVNITEMMFPNHSYTAYQGSLTTPPCTEGVTWVLLNTPAVISSHQVRAFQNAMGSVRAHGMTGVRTNNRPIQAVHNRTIVFSAHTDGKYVAPMR